jgi:hypothetical protein
MRFEPTTSAQSMVMELKILKANTSNLFKVLMDRKRIMSFLNCTHGRRRGKDHRKCKSARGFFRATRKDLIMFLCKASTSFFLS